MGGREAGPASSQAFRAASAVRDRGDGAVRLPAPWSHGCLRRGDPRLRFARRPGQILLDTTHFARGEDFRTIGGLRSAEARGRLVLNSSAWFGALPPPHSGAEVADASEHLHFLLDRMGGGLRAGGDLGRRTIMRSLSDLGGLAHWETGGVPRPARPPWPKSSRSLHAIGTIDIAGFATRPSPSTR